MNRNRQTRGDFFQLNENRFSEHRLTEHHKIVYAEYTHIYMLCSMRCARFRAKGCEVLESSSFQVLLHCALINVALGCAEPRGRANLPGPEHWRNPDSNSALFKFPTLGFILRWGVGAVQHWGARKKWLNSEIRNERIHFQTLESLL